MELGQRVKEKRLNTGIHAFKLMTSQINDNVSLFYSTRQSALQLSTEWKFPYKYELLIIRIRYIQTTDSV